jgi:predicted nucleic acid-binding protein
MICSNNSEHHELADAFAAALAKHKKAKLVTADTEFESVEKEIKINWLK